MSRYNYIEILQNYEGGYKQVVPVFSSVKVDGKKLRVLARSYEGYSISTEGEEVRVLFSNSNGQQYKVTLPKRDILINNIKLLKLGLIEKEEISKYFQNLENITVLPYVEIQFDCSKGTYVRQFAHDLGLEYKYPAVLAELERTRIGSISIDQCITIDELQSIN